MHRRLGPAVPRHFIGSLARIQIRGSVTAVEWRDRSAPALVRTGKLRISAVPQYSQCV